MSHTKTKTKPRTYAAASLLASNFLTVFGWALLTPLYALYAIQLGATPQMVTYSWALYTLLGGILMITLSRMEDASVQKARLLSIGYATQGAGVLVLLLATGIPMLLLGLAIHAVGTGTSVPLWKVLYAKSERKGHEAAGWGFFHGVNSLLISAAAGISGILYTLCGFRGILALMVLAYLLAAAVSIKIPGPNTSR